MAFDPFDDPRQVGILGAASGLLGASGPSRLPVSLGQAMGASIQRGILDRGAAEEIAARKMIREAQAAQLQEQIRAKQQAEQVRQRLRLQFGDMVDVPGFLEAWSKHATEAMYREPKPLEPPKTQPMNVGDEEVTREWDAQKGQWKEVARAPRWNPKPTPAASVSVQANFDTGNKEILKAQGKQLVESHEKYKEIPVQLANLQQAKALIPTAKGFMGPGGEGLLAAAKFMNNRLGMTINTEGVSGAEELRTRIFQNIMDNLKKMDAQPSQLQQQIMMQSLGSLGTDPNALVNVLQAYEDVLRGKATEHNKMVQGAKQSGMQFMFDPTIELPQGETIPAPASIGSPPPGAVRRKR